MNKLQNFIVDKSSAGSGKTYTLSLRYILISINGSINNNTEFYKKILAVTFTNKAANEMKERVLEYLQVLSQGHNKDNVLNWMKLNCKHSENQIIVHSKKILNSIIHNYSDFRISTIDKFTYKIVRSFSRDLGLSYDFDLEMDNDVIIRPVVDRLLSKVSDKGGYVSELIVSFALEKIREGKSFKIEKDLAEFTEYLFDERAIPFILINKYSAEEIIRIKDNLYKKREKISYDINLLSNEVTDYFNNYGFRKEHFIRGSFYKHFTVNLLDKNKWIPSKTLIRNVAEDIWFSDSLNDNIKILFQKHKDQFSFYFKNLLKLVNSYNTIDALCVNIYSISLLNAINIEVKEYKEEKNIEQISMFNKKINEIIVKQPSSFIYEHIGERFSHFLIDEFQDTSILQWQNLIPLIVDSLDNGSCFIVGDGKQAIYRWRGGDVKQFVNLPKIESNKEIPHFDDWSRKFSSHYSLYKNKNQNFRSNKNIIQFNNSFFDKLKDILPDNLRMNYENCKQNFEFATQGGEVKVNFFKNEKLGFKNNILKSLYEDLRRLKKDEKVKFKDIAILCNSRSRVSLVSNYLSEKSIPVVSNDGLLLNSSEKVRLIIDVINYLLFPNETIYKISIINYLSKNNKLDNLHFLHQKINEKCGFEEILLKYNISINHNKLLMLSVYELVEELFLIFKVESDLYTNFFLDFVLSFLEKDNSVNLFLKYWNERKDKESVILPEENDAVHILTIHKSKGLAFDVVMIPFNWEDSKNYTDIWVNSSEITDNTIPFSLIRSTSKLQYSDFHPFYMEEKYLSLMDSINKLYVAMTRARNRLYIYTKEIPKSKSDNFFVSGKLNSLFGYCGISENMLIGNVGVNEVNTKKQEKLVFNISKKNKLYWKDKVSLTNKSSMIEFSNKENYKKKNWGNLLHFALSKITNITEIDELCRNLNFPIHINENDLEKLISELKSILAEPKINIFFNKKWHVKSEKEILLPCGKTYIPDRILFATDKKKTIVIDYKTGVKNKNHQHQIINYANSLEQMGYKNIERYLIYTNYKEKVQKV